MMIFWTKEYLTFTTQTVVKYKLWGYSTPKVTMQHILNIAPSNFVKSVEFLTSNET